jgi:hypothetical protein
LWGLKKDQKDNVTFTMRQSPKKSEIKIFYTEKGLKYCQGISESAPIIDNDNWIQIGQKVLQDLSQNNILIKEWNKGVKDSKISPSVRNFILTISNLE